MIQQSSEAVHIVLWSGINENNIIMLTKVTLVAIGVLCLGLPTVRALDVNPEAEAKRLEAGLTRLCGVWEWTVHSHTMNHREAKSRIVLPTSEAAGTAGPSPSEIRIYGDAVYFRWNGPGGFQEDSMLLIDNNRLEGTFRTSSGAVGAINGRRLSGCQTNAAETSKSGDTGSKDGGKGEAGKP